MAKKSKKPTRPQKPERVVPDSGKGTGEYHSEEKK
jgi:hypothetical protein